MKINLTSCFLPARHLCVLLTAGGLLTSLTACHLSKKSQETAKLGPHINLDTVVVKPSAPNEPSVYRASATRKFDLLHTKLEVKFDWEKQYLFGKETITLTPYFYPQKEITLEGKGLEIKEVSLTGKENKKLSFVTTKNDFTITLDKEYTRKDTLKIFIDYIAKPNERETKTGNAISSDKGLYFINPLGKDKDKPTEIWTQGETEANSCWFPTFDKPNERMTQEIFITLDSSHTKFVTLSNGLLISSKKNSDGSRTDYWKQTLPAAPYLTMMAIGDFAIVKDKWRNLDVNYYVEKEYEPYAKAIFGNTPEMLEFFSTKLGVNYPWEKFSQVVVRDYVSGAMENTSAVLHGEFLNQTDRELLDRNHEDVISHELFHHWFGDYVTCESWANITLNEGFATYGEYLWEDYKYGRDAADHHAHESMQGYISSSGRNAKHLIRFFFNEPDDVFDAHSYNKGGAVIHMLRKYVGDDAFFAALKLYLNEHKFSSVEAHDLRLAFEKVTGEDLNWFFDEWFFAAGHPKISIQHHYNDSLKKYLVGMQQTQDMNKFPLFKFPIDIDIYANGKTERKRVWVNSAKEDFSFDVSQKPDFVNVDAEKMLLCTKEEKLSVQERIFEYKNCPLYMDRYEALKELSAFASVPDAANTILSALNDKYWNLRATAISYLEKLSSDYKNQIKEKLIPLAQRDEKSEVRAAAVDYLANNYKDADLNSIYQNAVGDRSYSVCGAGLSALAKTDAKSAMQVAKQFENDKSRDMLLALAQLYGEHGTDENNPFFVKLSTRVHGYENISFAMTYTDFLKHCSDSVINSGVSILENIARTEDNKWVRYFGQKGLKDLAQMYSDKEIKVQDKISKLKEQKPDANSSELKTLQSELSHIQSQKEKLKAAYDSVVTN